MKPTLSEHETLLSNCRWNANSNTELSWSCARENSAQPANTAAFGASTAEPPGRILSLIDVLADPAKLHGREIAVQGFFSHNHGEWVIAPDLTSLDHRSESPQFGSLEVRTK
jgi:hypothetical protein